MLGGIKVHPSVTCVFKASLALLLSRGGAWGSTSEKKEKRRGVGKNVEKNAEK